MICSFQFSVCTLDKTAFNLKSLLDTDVERNMDFHFIGVGVEGKATRHRI